jgi:hypothetical protein
MTLKSTTKRTGTVGGFICILLGLFQTGFCCYAWVTDNRHGMIVWYTLQILTGLGLACLGSILVYSRSKKDS